MYNILNKFLFYKNKNKYYEKNKTKQKTISIIFRTVELESSIGFAIKFDSFPFPKKCVDAYNILQIPGLCQQVCLCNPWLNTRVYYINHDLYYTKRKSTYFSILLN